MRRWPVGVLTLVSAGLVVISVLTWARPAATVGEDRAAEPSRYPYVVVVTAGTRECAGSVVAAEWILTTAECVRDVPSWWVYLYLANGRFVQAAAVVVHPLFDSLSEHGHDLALLQVPEGVTSGIEPVQVGAPWEKDVYAAGKMATRVGVARSETRSDGYRLRGTEMTIRADDEVIGRYRGAYGSIRWVGELMIGAEPIGRVPCMHERGDPLVFDRDGHHILIGLNSFALPDCNLPQGFAEMSGSQLAWVASWAPILGAWGRCTRPDGQPGISAVSYGEQRRRPEEVTEGPYYWSITCDASEPVST